MEFVGGTEKVASWIIYAVIFFAGVAIAGGAVWFFAVQKMKSLSADNDDNKRWEFGNVQGMLAILIVFAFIGVVFAFIFRPPAINEVAKESLSILLGFLGGQFVVICSFYFGSTVQNKTKDETVRLATAAQAVTATAQAKTIERVMTGTGNGNGHDPVEPPAPPAPPAPTATKTTTIGTETTKPPARPTDPVVTKTVSESVTVPTDPPKGGTG